MRKTLLAFSTATFGLLAIGSVRGDEVIRATLEAVATGGNPAAKPLKLELKADRPAAVKREPAYVNKPVYGVVHLGDAKENSLVVALDTTKDNIRPRLYVDVNGNGDLTDDPKITFTVLPAVPAKAKIETGDEPPKKPVETPKIVRYGASVPLVVNYATGGRAGQIPGTVTFILEGEELFLNREYGRVGRLKIGTRSYRIGLIDENLDARFSDFKHDDGEARKVTLLVDRNGDGKFAGAREMTDAAQPFRIGGAVYEISSIEMRGVQLALKHSDQEVPPAIAASELVVGSEAIDFEAEGQDGKKIAFPDDFKGKLVLLDFWSAGNPKSLQEIPNIVNVYNQFHEDGFEVLSINMDRPGQKKDVEAFVESSGMVWGQVLDGPKGEFAVSKLYEAKTLPYVFLVDGTTGKIVGMGSDVRGMNLAQKVRTILQKKRRRP